MKTITADTTDTQIAVRAAAAYYTDGAPPELCVRLVTVCQYLDQLPDGSWPETVQSWRQAKESFPRLNHGTARYIAGEARRMESARAKARHQRALSEAGRRVKALQPIIDRVVELSTNAREYPDHDGYYVDVIRSAYPQLDAATVRDLSMVCAHRVRALA